METAEEREARIRRLEETRRSKRDAEYPGGTVWPTPDDAGTGVVPLEIAPGRGDLNVSSGFVPTFPTALGAINRTISFARIFQSQPWVAAAVMRMLNWAIRVPLRAYEKKGNDAFASKPLGIDDHALANMIANPWPGGSAAQLVMALFGPVLIHGNSVTEVDDSHFLDGVVGLTPKDWRFSQPLMPWRGEIDGFRFDVDTPKRTHDKPLSKVLHIASWSPLGPVGTSPLMQLGTTITIEDAAHRYQVAALRHGGRPPSAITMDESILGKKSAERKAIMKQIRADIADLYGGPENAGRPALLPPGMDWKPVGSSTLEAELIDQRKIAREEIAAVYGIPPPLLGIMDRATYANIGVQRDMTYTDVLGPPLILIEQALNAQLVRDLLQDDKVFIQFDFSAVLRGDRLQEINALRDAIGSALMTPNEGRGVLNLERSDDDGMDDFYIPGNNLKPISSAKANPTPPQLQPFTGQPVDNQDDSAPNQEGSPSPWEGQPDQPDQKGHRLYIPDRAYETLSS